MRRILMMTLVAAWSLGTAGCHSPKARRSEAAAQSWDEVRARIKYQLARQQLEAGRAEESARSALEAIALDGRLLDAYVLLCRAQLEMGDSSAAQRTLAEARFAGLEAPLLNYFEGVAAEMRGDESAALACYRRAREQQPQQADFLAAEVELMVERGAPDAALELVKAHAQPDAKDATLDALGARLAVLVGDEDYAEACYRAASRKSGHPLLTLDYALFLMGHERFLEARSLLEPLSVCEGLGELRGPVHRALARCFLALNDSASTYLLLLPYVERESADLEAQLLLATAALAEGRDQAALRGCRSVLRVEPRNGEALMIEACVAARAGRATGPPTDPTMENLTAQTTRREEPRRVEGELARSDE